MENIKKPRMIEIMKPGRGREWISEDQWPKAKLSGFECVGDEPVSTVRSPVKRGWHKKDDADNEAPIMED